MIEELRLRSIPSFNATNGSSKSPSPTSRNVGIPCKNYEYGCLCAQCSKANKFLRMLMNQTWHCNPCTWSNFDQGCICTTCSTTRDAYRNYLISSIKACKEFHFECQCRGCVNLRQAMKYELHDEFSSWMSDLYLSIMDWKLADLCVLGSNQSGLYYKRKYKTYFQNGPIYDQLNCGVRFLDLKPLIKDGVYFGNGDVLTGRDDEEKVACGQKIHSIVEDINAFSQNNKEVIVIKLSDAINADEGARLFTNEEWQSLYAQLHELKHLYCEENPFTATMKQFLGDNHSSIVLLSDQVKPEVAFVHSLPRDGSYCEQPSLTSNMENMKDDQLSKLQTYKTASPSTFFVFSWLLNDTAHCEDLNVTEKIGTASLQRVSEALLLLDTTLSNQCIQSSTCHPNVISINLADTASTQFVINLNKLLIELRSNIIE